MARDLSRLTPAQRVERSIQKKYRDELWGPFIAGIKEYQLIQPGDRVCVCISGGKDSMLLAKLMQMLQKRSDFPFEVKYLVMDPGYTPENRQKILDNAALLDIPVEVRESEIFASVEGVEKNPCYLCARMRRGYLYKYAGELGCYCGSERVLRRFRWKRRCFRILAPLPLLKLRLQKEQIRRR